MNGPCATHQAIAGAITRTIRRTPGQMIQGRSIYEYLDPAAVFAMYTLSDVGAASADRNPREWDIEISRWGDPSGKSGRFVLQPSYVGQNTVWFTVPSGTLTYEARWEPGKVTLRSSRGAKGATTAPLIAENVYGSGAPVAGDEKFRINLYDFQRGPQLLKQGTEVVIERFEYLP